MTSRGWPADWSERLRGRDCPLCESIGQGDNSHTVAIAQLPQTDVGLERRSLLAGYCVVVWRHGHVAEPTELGLEEATGYWRDVMAVGRAVQAEFAPVKLNYLTLGNWVPHLHTHVVPRYLDDPSPGGPLHFDAMFAERATPDELLRQQADALRRRLGVA